MASKKTNENQNSETNRLTKKQTWFVLRIRTVTQSLRLFVPLFIKQNSDALNDKKKDLL